MTAYCNYVVLLNSSKDCSFKNEIFYAKLIFCMASRIVLYVDYFCDGIFAILVFPDNRITYLRKSASGRKIKIEVLDGDGIHINGSPHEGNGVNIPGIIIGIDGSITPLCPSSFKGIGTIPYTECPIMI